MNKKLNRFAVSLRIDGDTDSEKRIVAGCNDGSMWFLDASGDWHELAPIPGSEREGQLKRGSP